jgi:hypothetical protein
VEHLHPDCRLAVFDEIPIRHPIRPSFRTGILSIILDQRRYALLRARKQVG